MIRRVLLVPCVLALACSDAAGPPACPPGDGLGTWTALSHVRAPAHRYHHVMVNVEDKVLVWGGRGDDGLLGDGALFNPADNSWAALDTVDAPSPRDEFAWAYTGRFLVVWGGRQEEAVLGDGAAWDRTSGRWTPLPSLDAPAPRFRASAVAVDQRVYLAGGLDGAGARRDAAWLDLDAQPPRWTAVAAGVPLQVDPDPRAFAGQPVFLGRAGDYLVAFSGLGDGGPTARAASFRLPVGPWVLDDPVGAPPARVGAAVALAAPRKRLVVSGGLPVGAEASTDPAVFLDDLAEFLVPDPAAAILTNHWELKSGVDGVSLPRAYAGAAWTAWTANPDGALLVVGGQGPAPCRGGVLWLPAEDGLWARLNASACPRVGRMPGLAWVGERLVVFGGHRPPAQAGLGAVGALWTPP